MRPIVTSVAWSETTTGLSVCVRQLVTSVSRAKTAERIETGYAAAKAPTIPSKMTTSYKSWREPNTLGPQYVKSWKGHVPRVPQGGYVHGCGLSPGSTISVLDGSGEYD